MIKRLANIFVVLFVIDAYGSSSWYIQNSLVLFDERSSSFEDASFAFPGIVNNTAIGVSGDKFGINYRLRLENQSLFNPSSSEQNIILQELSRDFIFNNGLILNVGKTQIQLDEGISSQPLGFFQKEIDLSDVVDEKDESEGLPLIALNYISSKWSTSLIFSDDFESEPDGFNRGIKQIAMHVNYTRKWGEVGLILQRPENQNWGIGAVGNFGLNDNTVIYFSFFGRKGTRRPFYQLLESDSNISIDNPFLSSRLNDDEFYERYNVGVRWAYKDTDFTVEYSYDERGLDSDQWDRYLDLIDVHSKLATDVAGRSSSEIGQLNLGFDRQVLNRFNARQKYALFFANKEFERFSTSFFTRYEIESGGVFSGATFSYPHNDKVSLLLSLSHLGGRENSEFRINENSAVLELFIKYLF